MRTILFVSYGFMDSSTADTIQNKRLIKALSSYYDISVLCRSKSHSHNNVIAYETPHLTLIDRILYKLFPFLQPVFSVDMFYWCVGALRRCLKGPRFDCIINIHEPYPIRFLGFWLKKKWQSNLISLLYDPCYENLFFNQSNLGFWLRGKMEKAICVQSEVVCVNNSMYYERIRKRNHNSRIAVIPLCSDTKIVYSSNPQKNDAIKTIVHAGNIHGARTLRQLVESVELSKKRDPDISLKLRVLLYGDVPPKERNIINEHNCQDVILLMGVVDQKQLQEVLYNCNVLLLIDPPEGTNYSFPSKLCEYFALQKPILALSSYNSVSYQLLKKGNYWVFTANEIDKISETIISIANNRSELRPFDKNYYKEYQPDVVAASYVKIINSL